ncbi:MAG: signal peptidase II [Dissulfurispiraceae bacterium]|jgi:signal peptidase II
MRKSPIPFYAVALVVLAIDQITKYYVKCHIGPLDVVHVAPFFNIVYAENTGSAFGMFKSLGSLFFIVVSISAAIALSVMIAKDPDNGIPYSLLLGGATGNLLDRLLRGYVIDFLDVFAGMNHWPAFNVADSALTIGIILLLCKAARTERHD